MDVGSSGGHGKNSRQEEGKGKDVETLHGSYQKCRLHSVVLFG